MRMERMNWNSIMKVKSIWRFYGLLIASVIITATLLIMVSIPRTLASGGGGVYVFETVGHDLAISIVKKIYREEIEQAQILFPDDKVNIIIGRKKNFYSSDKYLKNILFIIKHPFFCDGEDCQLYYIIKEKDGQWAEKITAKTYGLVVWGAKAGEMPVYCIQSASNGAQIFFWDWDQGRFQLHKTHSDKSCSGEW